MSYDRRSGESKHMSKPAYRDKHPCSACCVGWLDCLSGHLMNLKCCERCNHPTRWSTDPPYTEEEMAAMKVDRGESV